MNTYDIAKNTQARAQQGKIKQVVLKNTKPVIQYKCIKCRYLTTDKARADRHKCLIL